jgi:hypothetical protein
MLTGRRGGRAWVVAVAVAVVLLHRARPSFFVAVALLSPFLSSSFPSPCRHWPLYLPCEQLLAVVVGGCCGSCHCRSLGSSRPLRRCLTIIPPYEQLLIAAVVGAIPR